MEIIRRQSLAKQLGISLPTLWRMEKAGLLPPKIRIGLRSVGWRVDDIEKMLDQREVRSVYDETS